MSKTQIIEKIQKLLALSKSSNINESQAAMLKVQELLVRHKMSMREVEQYEGAPVDPVEANKTKFTFDYKARWKGQLARVIADNFGCEMYFSTYRTHRIVFLGTEEDTKVCCIMYEYAVDTISKGANRIARSRNRQGLSGAGVLTDYALGFIAGAKEKFEAQLKANQEWGLVLTKSPAVVEAYNSIKFRRSVSITSAYNGNAQAYNSGYEEGKRFSISDKVSAADEDVQLALT